MGLPQGPLGSPTPVFFILEGHQVAFWMLGLLVIFVDGMLKLIIHISGPERAIVCRGNSLWSLAPQSPMRTFGQAGGSCGSAPSSEVWWPALFELQRVKIKWNFFLIWRFFFEYVLLSFLDRWGDWQTRWNLPGILPSFPWPLYLQALRVWRAVGRAKLKGQESLPGFVSASA